MAKKDQSPEDVTKTMDADIFEASLSELSVAEIADAFGVTVEYINEVVARYNEARSQGNA